MCNKCMCLRDRASRGGRGTKWLEEWQKLLIMSVWLWLASGSKALGLTLSAICRENWMLRTHHAEEEGEKEEPEDLGLGLRVWSSTAPGDASMSCALPSSSSPHRALPELHCCSQARWVLLTPWCMGRALLWNERPWSFLDMRKFVSAGRWRSIVAEGTHLSWLRSLSEWGRSTPQVWVSLF